ncbi:single-stranded-DNA-specific exonuclease RecJ [Bartonella vinsonii subsp. arupensis OK-94-513]|uniref:Single-stranded-DNA-specific exonuclease RecJ n=2 Tax=Bartonella vinsonii subsp. arupensis TaxID=110578 RepID=J0R557_BARVI|nr:single-stranded-DNA-specific exonuclease RecJ [Bartonella vinsonii]EJF90809.1 single-stranded-DNA-specific exonuclease RecJ [Bartonella vinsonii subsp. arupensis OK-94-513]EJF97566.1 single-stranded-DNA-specific exonuclease RecJ [Bartonella vinsonii subsp. arupensis Pm136co]
MQRSRYFLNVKSSACGQAWLDALDVQGVNNAHAISQKFGFPDALARVLSARDVDESEAVAFIDPTLRSLMPDPESFVDMQCAAERIVKAILNQEKVAVFGDYDVDGACSSALVARFLRYFGAEVIIYIPDRIVEGYGPNEQAMKMLVQEGARLIITVDCGANSPDAVKAVRLAGADVVVLDHHQMSEVHQEAVALVNPNRPDDSSGQGHLCAAGVVFVTLAWVNHLLKKKKFEGTLPDLLSMLDLVALATICDVVPLQGVNRAFVVKGLQVARSMHNHGILALTKVARIGEPLNSFHLGFLLGPRINAGGRIGDQALGARLLSCEDKDEANRIAEQLDQLNQERQEMEGIQLAQAESYIDSLYQNREMPLSLVIAHAEWHPGIIGILASRLKERFFCPVFAIALKEDGSGVGSGRSINGVDLGALVREAVTLNLLEKGGGHSMAAGITIQATKIEIFREWLEEKVSLMVSQLRAEKSLRIDGCLSASGANQALFEMIEKAGPFGSGNATPVFVLPSHRLINLCEVGKGHLRLVVSNIEGKKLQGIAFRAVGTSLGHFLSENIGEMIHLAGNLSLNYWNGTITPQLRVIDAAAVV